MHLPREISNQKIDPELVEILPTGEVYLSQVHYRRVLNELVGAARWRIIPVGDWETVKNADGNPAELCRTYALEIDDVRVVPEAYGSHLLYDSSSQGEAREAVKSSALVRACKDLGIFWQLWDRNWIDPWIAEHAVQVVRTRQKGNQHQWRRKKDQRFWDEAGAEGQEPTSKAPQETTGSSAPPPPAEPPAPKKERDATIREAIKRELAALYADEAEQLKCLTGISSFAIGRTTKQVSSWTELDAASDKWCGRILGDLRKFAKDRQDANRPPEPQEKETGLL